MSSRIVSVIFAVALMLMSLPAFGQGGVGAEGGARGGAPTGNARQSALDAIKAALGVTDAEWTKVEPLVGKVYDQRQLLPATLAGQSGGARGGGGVGRSEAGADAGVGSTPPTYLWKEGNVPAITKITETTSRNADPPDFRPNMVYFPAKQGVKVKGAVLVCAGGAFVNRANRIEGTPVAQQLSELGYQSYVVNYRLRPYTQQEGALDLARAVRYVRSHARDLGIEEKDIAVMGFSAGGILCGEMLLNFDRTVNGTALDPKYVPDELDKISADASAVGMIYSFFGILSFASTDVEKFKASNLPPAYFLYGTRDPFVDQFEACVKALKQAGIPVESHALQGLPHGFGAGDGKWVLEYDKWLADIFAKD